MVISPERIERLYKEFEQRYGKRDFHGISMVRRGSERFYRPADVPRTDTDCSGVQFDVAPDSWVSDYRECSNQAQVERGGKWWCYAHDPAELERLYRHREPTW